MIIQVTAFITLGKSGEGPAQRARHGPADGGHGRFGNGLVLWGFEIRFHLVGGEARPAGPPQAARGDKSSGNLDPRFRHKFLGPPKDPISQTWGCLVRAAGRAAGGTPP